MTFRRGAVLGALLLAGAMACAAAPDAKRWEEALRAAQAAAKDYDSGQALAHYRDALREAEQFGESDPRLVRTLAQFAQLCEEGDVCPTEDGESYLSRALKIRPKTITTPTATWADALMDLGAAAYGYGKYREALVVYRDALDIREKLYGPQHEKAAEVWAAMAWAYLYQGDKAQARRTFQHALELREQAGAGNTAEFALLLDESARLYGSQGDQKSMAAEYDRAIAIRARLWKPGDKRFVDALRDIAEACEYHKDASYSERLFLRIIEIEKQAHTERSEQYYRALARFAAFRQYKQRWADAEALYQAALAVRQRLGKSSDLQTADCLESIARVRVSRGLHREAIEPAQRSLAIRLSLLKPSDYQVSMLQSLLAESYAQLNDPVDSEASFRALAQDARPYQVISTAEKLGELYYQRGDYARAAEKFETAVATYELKVSAEDDELTRKLLRLGQTYQAMGRIDDANRVSLRITQITWRQVKKAASGRVTVVVLVVVLAFLLVPVMVLGIVQFFLHRHLNRKLAALFEPPAPPPAVPVLVEVAEGAAGALEPAPAAVEPQPAEPPPPLPVQRFSFHGDGGSLFAIRVLNLLLTLVTLGVYYFWGKAKVRRYLYSQAEFDDDRFAFHGTGKELMIGWLKGLPFLAVILFLPNVLPLFWQSRNAIVVAQLCAFAALMLLWPIARAGAYRYRLNRMSWRGVRFSFRGRTFRFLLLNLIGYLLTALTFGIYAPFLAVRVRRFLFDQTYFGDTPFRFSGHGRHLLATYLIAVPLTIATLGLYWAWWSALRSRYYWAHTTFAGARFRCTATGGKLLRLWLGNLLLIVPTIGLAMPWVIVRTARFWTTQVHFAGDLDLGSIRQDAQATSALGESFADFLGFDFGF